MQRVYTTGVFDLFHVGHLSILKKAKDFGDYLIVGVHPDGLVESYKRTPIVPFEERMEIVKNITCVDEVIEAPLTRMLEASFYEEHKIDVHVAGDNMHEFYELPSSLGIMKFVDRYSGTDTTTIISRILDRKLTT